ncbi:Uncharacterised protein [Serratia quinivorans]|uniref:Uncharacterized protein n=1 Tax=Serratia quinivorans TaxID=137545 RepID=A0A380AVA9_9GAMM|nr:Uncharacterised protein [Serratia quinivorans]
MSEPIKPRIDFEQPLEPPQEPVLRANVAFDEQQAEHFFPAAPELQQEEEEGRAEGIINAALKPKRSLWRKMVTAGLTLFGVSVVAQGVQWGAYRLGAAGLDRHGRRRGGWFDCLRRGRFGGDRMAQTIPSAPACRRTRCGT